MSRHKHSTTFPPLISPSLARISTQWAISQVALLPVFSLFVSSAYKISPRERGHGSPKFLSDLWLSISLQRANGVVVLVDLVLFVSSRHSGSCVL